MSKILILIGAVFLGISSAYADTDSDTTNRYWIEAASDLTKATEINPGAEQDNLLQEAITDYTKFIGIDSNPALDFELRGIAFFIQGNLPQAISDYTKASALYSGHDAEAHYYRGNAYAKQGNLPQAISDYNKAIELNLKFAQPFLDRKYSEAHFERCFIYYKQGNYIRAINDFNKAIEINPNYLDTHYDNDHFYYEHKKQLDAISDYIKIIEINPKIAEDNYNRGGDIISKVILHKPLLI